MSVQDTTHSSTKPVAVPAATADIHAPSSNTAAVVTYAADTTGQHCISGVAFSYVGGTPTGGNLKIEDGAGVVVFSMDIKAEGHDVVNFVPPKKNAAVNTALIITLAAGGSGVTGKVSILAHWVER